MLLSALPEVVTGILTFLASVAGPVAGIVAAVVFAVKRERKKALAKVESEPPAALPHPAQLPSPAFGHEVTGKLLDALEKRTERVVADLQKQLAECQAESAQLAEDVRRTANALLVAERDKHSADVKIATLERSLAEWRATAARLEDEKERLRAQLRKERVDPDTIVTPMRPPRRST